MESCQRSAILLSVFWPYKSCISTLFNKNCAELVDALVQCVCQPQDEHISALLRCIQSLLALVMQLRCIVVKRQNLHTRAGLSPLHFYATDPVHLLEFVRCLQRLVTERLTSQQVETLFASMCDDWLVCAVCKEALETLDESLLPLSTCADRPLTLHEIVNKYFYLLPPLVSHNCDVTSQGSPPKRQKRQDDCAEDGDDNEVHVVVTPEHGGTEHCMSCLTVTLRNLIPLFFSNCRKKAVYLNQRRLDCRRKLKKSTKANVKVSRRVWP